MPSQKGTYGEEMGDTFLNGRRLVSRAARGIDRWGYRAIPERFTEQQRAFVEAVRDTRDHLMLRGTAGAGKTTTLTEAAWHLNLSGKGQFFAYNKHSVTDVGPRLPLRVKASTLHGYGLGILSRARDAKVDLDNHKSDRLAQQLARVAGGGRDGRQQRALVRAWDLAREYSLDEHAHEDDLIGLAVDAEWPDTLGIQGLVRSLSAMRQASLADWRAGGLPDFTLETNRSNVPTRITSKGDIIVDDLPHIIITALQVARTRGFTYTTTIDQELQFIVSDGLKAGLSTTDVQIF